MPMILLCTFYVAMGFIVNLKIIIVASGQLILVLESPKVGVVIGPFQNLSYERGWIKIPENIHRKGFQQSPSGIF